MSDTSVARLIARCREGDSQAQEQLFERNLQRLMAMVRRRISRKLAVRFDPEDVVQSAYRSFFSALDAGRFIVTGEDDLWRLLAAITLHKLHRKVAHEHAQKRTPQKERHLAADTSAVGLPAEMIAKEPTPADAAALIEEVELVMQPLDVSQRQMLELRLQGHSVEEIAAQMDRSERTVRRLMEKVRMSLQQRLWESQAS